ncbi:MAG: ferrochelatase [Hyphomicrobiales bacterium]
MKNNAAAMPVDHPQVSNGKVGVLLINLGTPEATDFWSMRRYLKEFLWDRRVIEAPRLLWWIILNGIILNTRPKKSGHAYDQIWNREKNESPLKTITRAQVEKLTARFSASPNVTIDWAMRYGLPPIAEKVRGLKDAGCERILLFPLYPQYSATTTASVQDKAFDALKDMRWQPAIRTVPCYHDHPGYIDALAGSLEDHIKTLEWKPDLVLASFHGLPKEYLLKGDPYHCQCQKTGRLMREKLNMGDDELVTVFQSRFGSDEWLQPYAEDTVIEAAQGGVKNLVMIMPGFVADCVETLEEIAIGLNETFIENGGENFSAVPCLNDSEPSIDLIFDIVSNELKGWV